MIKESDLCFTLTISGDSYQVSRGAENAQDLAGELVIPPTHNGKPVTRIADKGFYMCPNITGVSLPRSMETIGERAFASCTALSKLVLSNGLKTIGGSAFLYCRGLTAVAIPDSVESIATNAFANCPNLVSPTVSKKVRMGDGVFFGSPFSGKDPMPVPIAHNSIPAEFIAKYKLSKRQAETAAAVLQTMTNKQIARSMNIKVNTVQVHLQNLYRKTGTASRYALISLVERGNEKKHN